MKKQIIYPLMAALTFCAALTFNGCGASTGFVEQPNDGNQTVIENPFDGEIVKDGESYSFGRAIAFLGADVAPIDEEVYTPVTATLTATVEPIDANQNVIWTTSFVNPSSTWANGKTVSDYITLATETAGSTTCTVTCKAPFGEQIIITCTSQENSAVSASCTVDFYKKLEGIKNLQLMGVDDKCYHSQSGFSEKIYDDGTQTYIAYKNCVFECEYSVGTLIPSTPVMESLKIGINQRFRENIVEKEGALNSWVLQYLIVGNIKYVGGLYLNFLDGINLEDEYDLEMVELFKDTVCAYVASAAAEVLMGELQITITDEQTTLKTNLGIYAAVEDWKLEVKSITLSSSNLYFK